MKQVRVVHEPSTSISNKHRRIWGHILGGAHIQARMRKSGPDCNKNKTPRLML